jgi:hypothetical protein
MAGGYPGSEDSIEEDRNLKGLIHAGIRHVISLIQPQEYNRPDEPFAPYPNLEKFGLIMFKIYQR